MYIKKAIIDRFEEGKAVIQTEDRQTLYWECDNLPPSIKEGSEVILEIKHGQALYNDQQELAETILQELFNTSPNLTQ